MPVRHSCHWFSEPVGLIKKADIVIIGGGLAGISLLYRLCSLDPDINVVLLEENFPGYHTSGRTLGCVRSVDVKTHRKLKHDLGDKVWLYHDFVSEGNRRLFEVIQQEYIKCDLRLNGGLQLATTLAEMGYLRSMYEELSSRQFVQMFDESEVQSLLDTQRFKRGLFIPDEATLHPFLLLQEMSEVVEQTGRRIIQNAKVDRIVNRPHNEVVVHVRNRGRIVTQNVVYCTGAYTSEFVPLTNYIKSHKQHYFATKMLPDNIIGKLPSMSLHHRDKTLRLEGNALLAVGQADETKSLDDGEIEQKDYDRLRHSVNSVYPGLTKRFGVESVWSSVDCTGVDELPIVGPVPRLPGHFLNIGHGFHGFGSAMASADVLTEYLLSGKSKHAAADLISPDRF